MEIKEGMYVRTHRGIAKIVEKPNISVVVWNDRKVIYVDKNGHQVPTSFNFLVFEDEITVFSFNITNLIQVGDYVNGEKVTETMIKMRDEQGVFGLPDHYRMFVDEIHIKSVVTKEQFESIKYVVERDK